MSFTSGDSTQSNETFGKDVSFKLHQLTGALSISPSGRDVVLGSKEGLHVIDLDSPYSPPRFLPHRTPWEVADVQWSPFADRDYWVVSTSNQKALVWNLEASGWRNSIEHVLHGHTRAITDINFSAHHKDVLATCAVDSFVQCWDLRTPDRPVMSFSDWFAGATQVKFSRQDEHVLASSHDRFLHIWDDRKGAYPARTIEAHNTKIYGIDWNRFEPSKIVTCSLDKTIKFWDTNNPEDVPDRVIETSFPVWRARHTPFGYGLMVMPQRGNGDLHLFDRRATDGVIESGRVQPVQVFPGHKGQVKEFLWRAMGTVQEGVDHRDFQLVTWGTDRELRLHAVSQKTFEDIGYQKGVSRPQRLRFTRKGAKYRTFRDEVEDSELSFANMARYDSFLSSNQLLRLKGRRSTNVGMSKASLSQFKGWLQTGKGDRRTGMHGKGAVRPDTDPISWMKNVKIASTSNDALADEITQVGERFKKVDFETVDITQRKATLSVQSLLGEQGTTTYTRVDLRFPKAYPREAQAITHLQRMNSLSHDAHKKISSDMQKIAEVYLSRGRGCIEAIVRYLLREQSLEQIIDFIMVDSMTDSKLLDVNNLADDASDDSDDDQLDSVIDVANATAENRVPLAKRCGAMWSESGKLVCFFLPKNTEPASLLSTLGTGQLDEPDPGRLFGGFGKFQMDTGPRKQKDMSASGDDEMAPETSDDESMFSASSSSLSSDSSAGFDTLARFAPQQRTTLQSLQRSRSAEGSQKSANLDSAKSAETGRKAFWIIHDFTELLPSNEMIAKDYQIYGEVVTVCEQNAKAAAKQGVHEVANTWALTALTFKKSSATQIAQFVAQDLAFKSLTERLAVISSNRPCMMRPKSALPSRNGVQHSLSDGLLGATYLIPAMLEYFEKKADVQMLAVLSAVLMLAQEPFMMRALKSMSNAAHSQRAGLPPPHIPYLSQISLRSLEGQSRSSQSRGVVIDQNLHERVPDELKPRDSDVLALMSPSLSRTGGSEHSGTNPGTPSLVQRDPNGYISAIHSGAASISTSPEIHRTISRRSDLSTATASLYAIARHHTGTSPVQTMHADREHLQRSSKSTKVSPDDSSFSDSRYHLRSSLSLANVSGYQNESTRTMPPHQTRIKSILKHNTSIPAQRIGERKKKKLKTRLSGAATSADELHTSPIVLPFDMYPTCLTYIKQYVDLLEIWRLWPQRAEMQKLHARLSAQLQKLVHGTNTSSKPYEIEKGLEIRRCCQSCSHLLVPIEKNGIPIGWDCVSEKCTFRKIKSSRMQKCSLCEVIANGLTVPCLQCGHLTCYDCAQEWFLRPTSKDRQRSASSTGTTVTSTEPKQGNDDDRTCPTGCGCPCPTVGSASISYPLKLEVEIETDDTPTTSVLSSRSESYLESPKAPTTVHEPRGQRLKSVTGADNTALSALLALNLTRTRSISSSKTQSTVGPGTEHVSEPESGAVRRPREHSISTVDELLPWASDHQATLSKGVGGGLSRGLRNVGSDATIRRI